MIKVDDRVEIKGSNIDIVSDFMALVHALYEGMVLEGDLTPELFQDMLSKALEIAIEGAQEDAAEQVEVEQSDYLS